MHFYYLIKMICICTHLVSALFVLGVTRFSWWQGNSHQGQAPCFRPQVSI